MMIMKAAQSFGDEDPEGEDGAEGATAGTGKLSGRGRAIRDT
jgi:hypothetical protein